MYIDLGGEQVIRSSELIAIFEVSVEQDLDVLFQYLKNPKISEKEPIKSVVLTSKKIYFSSISATTLKKRANITELNI